MLSYNGSSIDMKWKGKYRFHTFLLEHLMHSISSKRYNIILLKISTLSFFSYHLSEEGIQWITHEPISVHSLLKNI